MRRCVVVSWIRLWALLIVAASVPAQVLFTLQGDAPGDELGTSITGLGDVNLDGWVDFAVGAPGADLGAVDGGAVHFVSGLDGSILKSWLGTRPGEGLGVEVCSCGDVNRDGRQDVLARRTAGWEIYDAEAGEVLHALPGDRAAAAGDVNRDGHADVILGYEGGGIANGGWAQVISGADGRQLWRVDGEQGGDGFAVVAGVGDVNADGFADFAVGAPTGGGFLQPYVSVFDGASGARLHRLASGAFLFGSAVSPAGDLDGDGRGDFVVGAPDLGLPCQTGFADVFSGADGGRLQRIFGRAAPACAFPVESGVGRALRLAGDVDGDGFGDLLVGSDQRLRAVSGRDGRNLLVVGASGRGFDGAFSAIGDWNQDSVDDLLLGDPERDGLAGPRAGAVWVLSGIDRRVVHEQHAGVLDGGRFVSAATALAPGGSSGATQLAVGREGSPTSYTATPELQLWDGPTGAVLHRHRALFPGLLRSAVARAGDIDADGVGDWVVGWHGGSGPATSFVEVVSGRDAAVLFTFRPPGGGSKYGTAVIGGLDWNGDTIPDVVIGWPGGEAGPGRVEVRSGRDGLVLRRLTGEDRSREFGAALCLVGDVDGDGIDELAVAAADRGSVELRSIGTGRRVVQARFGVGFGRAVVPVGDADGDGLPDLAVSSPAHFGGRGGVFLLRGYDAATLSVLVGAPGSGFGHALAGGRDADGDGRGDLVVGAPQAASGAGEVLVFALDDETPVARFQGIEAGDGFGSFVALVGDQAGNGLSEVVAGASAGGWGSEVDPAFVRLGYVRMLAIQRGGFGTFGRGCVGVAGVPRLQARSSPELGTPFALQVDRIAGGHAGALMFGRSDRVSGALRLPQELGPAGMPGCVLRVGRDIALPLVGGTQTSAATLTIPLPADPSFFGARFFVQHVHTDPIARQGLVLSDAGRFVLGL
ncbi:MAG: FG-GAP-like repeat-containing protein [Planctomycetota bacterium]